jgi:hypothetical protein
MSDFLGSDKFLAWLCIGVALACLWPYKLEIFVFTVLALYVLGPWLLLSLLAYLVLNWLSTVFRDSD